MFGSAASDELPSNLAGLLESYSYQVLLRTVGPRRISCVCNVKQ